MLCERVEVTVPLTDGLRVTVFPRGVTEPARTAASVASVGAGDWDSDYKNISSFQTIHRLLHARTIAGEGVKTENGTHGSREKSTTFGTITILHTRKVRQPFEERKVPASPTDAYWTAGRRQRLEGTNSHCDALHRVLHDLPEANSDTAASKEKSISTTTPSISGAGK